MQRRLTAALAVLATLAVSTTAGAATYPDRLDLPDGWQPEGIAAGKPNELFVGSIPTGDIWRFNARTGRGGRVIDAPSGSQAIGLKVVSGRRLVVAGGPTGRGFVYSIASGRQIASFRFAPPDDTFVNDVAVTRRHAYFTDSRRSVLYVINTRRLGGFRELPLPDIPAVEGFNLNGIAASANGRTLLAVSGTTGFLWRINARTGRAARVDLGDTELTNGDGLLLRGRTLYVVQNRLNQIAVVRLARGYRRGRLASIIQPQGVDVPTTIAHTRGRLYLVNARFGTRTPESADYWVTQVYR